MAEPPVFSSQGSQYESYQVLRNQENLGSSPLQDADVAALSSQKLKKAPTVTPKRFTKFFTPRNTLQSQGRRQSKAGRQLQDITKNGANRRRNARPLHRLEFATIENNEVSGRPLKRRKRSIDIVSSPPQSSPLKHVQTADQIRVFEDVPLSPTLSTEDELLLSSDEVDSFPEPIRLMSQFGRNRRMLQCTFGGYDTTARGWRGYDHCADWQAEIANFASTPDDVHAFTGSALPFCTASCNSNSLVAIGEEEGSVRIVDSARSSDFKTAHVTFRPHHNAIMDVTFSSDDYMLATASGDQTARIVDMHTQQTICILSGHKSSLKQVRFQPSDDNMITTSSRDGSVQIWDMRCGPRGSVAELRTAFARNVDTGDNEPPVRYSKHTLDIGSAYRSTKSNPNATDDSVSITSIQHLPHGREHLLLTTSGANSSIKVWDLRNASRRNGVTIPLSSTPVPENHSRTRHYGINAMVLSGDSGRLYTACRDGMVYAYSTNHLILGAAPEMALPPGKARMANKSKAGAGPLYRFNHPLLRLGSFYVKASLRPAQGDKSELLAVASSDNCTVLFPTDERHLPEPDRQYGTDMDGGEGEETDLPYAPPKSIKQPDYPPSHLPTHEQGTALVRGHNREVTSLTWTHDGELVTISDDYTARCWREDAENARELRGCGEGGGRRWGCGWAEMDAAWDEEEG